ncbi:MAG TPA: CBS domain-containing protein [Longimicrobiales bacterium]|jgi:CBS domain-containing protein
MRISDILQHKGRDIVTIAAHDTVHAAIRRLNEHRIGALVVLDADGGLAGIISERDILRECGERCVAASQSPGSGEDACPAVVGDLMTTDLVIGLPSDSLGYVMGIMTKNRIRHLPVLDDGALVGIISIGDVVNAHVEAKEFENRQLRDYIQGVTY